uniref:Nucleotide exchange factor SIL1 n=1 Tax=Pinguiococcus pyrenoidosus TaxID=172671 RepID=A0A7R9U9J5_9STRA|mmetsp:Transcript_2129/g.9320  ORF Transcript_2129/g.9320 Transcript_2129/m.9320 type:complete len:399 (+) Transcript_2129:68-1264(+)
MRIPRLLLCAAVCASLLVRRCGAEDPPGAEDDGHWRVLGPDESVPPGAHVRLNITSLEKTVRVDAAGEIVIGAQDLTETQVVATDSAAEEPASAVDAGREMMKESLLKLPDAELARYGVTHAELSTPGAWEDRIDGIWQKRQQDLREAIESMGSHVNIFLERIMVLSAADSSEEDVMKVLLQLEDDLMDIDMARDFHTVGGWPALTGLLADSHAEDVRCQAALVVGNTVRNTPEFQAWVSEVPMGSAADVEEATMMHLLVSMMNSSASTAKEQSKALSALSGALYNHVENLQLFADLDGSAKLLALLDDAVEDRLSLRAIRIVSDLAFEAAESGDEELKGLLGGIFDARWCRRTEDLASAAKGAGTDDRLSEAVSQLIDHVDRSLSWRQVCELDRPEL